MWLWHYPEKRGLRMTTSPTSILQALCIETLSLAYSPAEPRKCSSLSRHVSCCSFLCHWGDSHQSQTCLVSNRWKRAVCPPPTPAPPRGTRSVPVKVCHEPRLADQNEQLTCSQRRANLYDEGRQSISDVGREDVTVQNINFPHTPFSRAPTPAAGM